MRFIGAGSIKEAIDSVKSKWVKGKQGGRWGWKYGGIGVDLRGRRVEKRAEVLIRGKRCGGKHHSSNRKQ
jgi:hypothetical protein